MEGFNNIINLGGWFGYQITPHEETKDNSSSVAYNKIESSNKKLSWKEFVEKKNLFEKQYPLVDKDSINQIWDYENDVLVNGIDSPTFGYRIVPRSQIQNVSFIPGGEYGYLNECDKNYKVKIINIDRTNVEKIISFIVHVSNELKQDGIQEDILEDLSKSKRIGSVINMTSLMLLVGLDYSLYNIMSSKYNSVVDDDINSISVELTNYENQLNKIFYFYDKSRDEIISDAKEFGNKKIVKRKIKNIEDKIAKINEQIKKEKEYRDKLKSETSDTMKDINNTAIQCVPNPIKEISETSKKALSDLSKSEENQITLEEEIKSLTCYITDIEKKSSLYEKDNVLGIYNDTIDCKLALKLLYVIKRIELRYKNSLESADIPDIESRINLIPYAFDYLQTYGYLPTDILDDITPIHRISNVSDTYSSDPDLSSSVGTPIDKLNSQLDKILYEIHPIESKVLETLNKAQLLVTKPTGMSSMVDTREKRMEQQRAKVSEQEIRLKNEQQEAEQKAGSKTKQPKLPEKTSKQGGRK